MRDETSPNGHVARSDEEREIINAYADAVSATRPPEIVEFELNTDPYANMVPQSPRGVSRADPFWDDAPARRNPWIVAISLLLIVVLLLPVVVQIFSRLGV